MMKTEFYQITDPAACPAAIERVASLLRQGEVAAIPTETVYGLAGSAFSADAVKKIFEAKGRPQDNPLIVHISDLEMLPTVAGRIPEDAYKLAKAFWPGPLTVILPKKDTVPAVVSAGLDTVAVRFPSHPVAAAIIRAAGLPLAAPSANLSGFPSPTEAQHVIDDLTGRVAAIVDGGPCGFGIESTVVTLAGETPRLLRPGVITREQLEEVLGKTVEIDPAVLSPLQDGQAAASPGMKYKHYAPNAKLTVIKGGLTAFLTYVNAHPDDADHVLCFEEEAPVMPLPCVTMGRRADPLTQTRRLFDALRELDADGAKRVFARAPEPVGIGLGVCNRLYRAAGFTFAEMPGVGRVIGVSGGSGSGKSTVCERLRDMGCVWIDTDAVAREIVQPGSPVLPRLQAAFGADILRPDGSLDRALLAQRAFADAETSKTLSAITHPAIVGIVKERMAPLLEAGKTVLIDAPLLFTSGLSHICDLTVKVTAPEAERVRRIMQRDGISQEAALRRIRAQAQEDALSDAADLIIVNDDLAELEGKAENILKVSK